MTRAYRGLPRCKRIRVALFTALDSAAKPSDGRGRGGKRIRTEGKAGTLDFAVKRREFVRGLIDRGCYLKRHVAPVPRHNEIKNTLVRAIRKQLGLE